MIKTAIVSGVSGQDGAFLSKILLNNGYHVIGTSRNVETTSFDSLEKLGVKKDIELVSLSPLNLKGIIDLVEKKKPIEIYNLSGQSSVGLSFIQPHNTLESIIMGTLNFLEAIRFSGDKIKFYNAGSSEMFGNSTVPVTENTSLSPQSPYGVAKAASFFEVANYRKAYNLHASTGILFNHESPFRGENFVTKKIIKNVVSIASGSNVKLELGNINIKRDWGWAPEYMEAVYKMLQQEIPQDIIIASGETNSLEDFLEISFKYFNLNWKDYVIFEENLKRPSDLDTIYADTSKARDVLNWSSKVKFQDIVQRMLEYELGKAILF